MSAPDSNSVRETPGHSVTSAPDWPRVAEALDRQGKPIWWTATSQTQVERLMAVEEAARWALQHGPAVEAADTVWWCEPHETTATSELRVCWKYVWLGSKPKKPCRIVERRLLPGEAE